MNSSSFYQKGKSNFKQSGFTLLELVLVLFIVALIATTPLLFIDDQDNQIRYDETLQKMQMIRDAIIQRQEYRNQPVLSGFVIDNGVLPPVPTGKLDSLINYDEVSSTWLASSGWQAFTAVAPYFNTGTTGKLNDDFALNKGYRSAYITRGLDSEGLLKDGWGNEFSVAASTANGYHVSFNSPDVMFKNREISILENEWLISPQQLNINLLNQSGASAAIAELALLVYNNNGISDESRWDTYHFSANIPPSPTDASGAIIQYQSLHSNAADWQLNDSDISDALPTIPAGEHLVIFNPQTTSDPSTTPHDIIRVLPGATQPSVTLLVSPE
ncbi:type II secretion system protein [uncultured Methylophaga sp.]|uniref:type II secretion system protein n=1 Tax=uncultured Methylophaga sp. TaxID=285271 RepID=UPI00261C9ED3|nr:type II secretion system protein [uncultured Methylophaga sp.]